MHRGNLVIQLGTEVMQWGTMVMQVSTWASQSQCLEETDTDLRGLKKLAGTDYKK